MIIPAVIGAHLLEIRTLDKLDFHRNVYIDLKSGIKIEESNRYLFEADKICNKKKVWCIDAIKTE
ncbi:hypothetical protein [Phocicoccus pinnipedialis]|uniref:hypothetical protein n=1 Tax=Phocicoccus pinnipedialis TaxID=110845 RepID=UPI001640BFF4|nr:hypothetical protein [Jeotgalicoccus pinnipedialis]